MAFGDDDDLPSDVIQIKRVVDRSKQSIGSPNVIETSLASIESLTMPLMQEVVLSADIRCAQCQKRVADVMSRMTGPCLPWDENPAAHQYIYWLVEETESVVVNVLEKKVTLSCKYPKNQNGIKGLRGPRVPVVYRSPLKLDKVAAIKRLFRLSSS